MPVRRHVLPSASSDPARNALDVQSALDALGQDVSGLSASDIAYTPANAGDWTAPLPTTVADALDRLAVGGGPPW